MKERGSTKILLERFGRREFKDEELKETITALDMDGVDIVDYFPYGIPKPDVVSGRLRVKPTAFPQLAAKLIELKGVQVREIKVFPEGIIAPDILLVDFQMTPGFSR